LKTSPLLEKRRWIHLGSISGRNARCGMAGLRQVFAHEHDGPGLFMSLALAPDRMLASRNLEDR